MPPTRTESEVLFERFCTERKIAHHAIPVADQRTPDYEFYPGGELVIVEVTQLDANPDDRRVEGGLKAGEMVSYGGTIGQRLRQKLTDKVDQLRVRSKGQMPTLLVVYNNTAVASYTAPEHVRAAMFGFDTVVLAVPKDPRQSPYAEDRRLGKGAKATSEHNTSLSAVGILERDADDRIGLRVYHNVHARSAIVPAVLRFGGIHQFVLEERRSGEFQNWICLDP